MILNLSTTRVVIGLYLIGPGIASGSDDCLAEGKYISDEPQTLASLGASNYPADALNAFSRNLFGHMIHEWRCTSFRGYDDRYIEEADENPEAGWSSVTVVNRVGPILEILLTSDDESQQLETPMTIQWEGDCYKIPVNLNHGSFFEYFCPAVKNRE